MSKRILSDLTPFLTIPSDANCATTFQENPRIKCPIPYLEACQSSSLQVTQGLAPVLLHHRHARVLLHRRADHVHATLLSDRDLSPGSIKVGIQLNYAPCSIYSSKFVRHWTKQYLGKFPTTSIQKKVLRILKGSGNLRR